MLEPHLSRYNKDIQYHFSQLNGNQIKTALARIKMSFRDMLNALQVWHKICCHAWITNVYQYNEGCSQMLWTHQFFLSKVLFKRLQRRVSFAPCMFGAIPDIPFSNKYVMKDKKPMVTVNVWNSWDILLITNKRKGY